MPSCSPRTGKETAVIIAYDDSDGWYDHQMGPIVMQSHEVRRTPAWMDQLLGPGNCGTPKASDVTGGTQNGRCGYGPRQRWYWFSPWAKRNYVDHRVTDLSSILRFVEDNWNLGRVGGGSVDAIAGTMNGMFDFDQSGHQGRLILESQTGTVLDSE